MGLGFELGLGPGLRLRLGLGVGLCLGLGLGLGLSSTWWPLGACSPSSRCHRLWCATRHTVTAARPRLEPVRRTHSRAPPRGTLPCASGTYGMQEAGTRTCQRRSSPAPMVTSEHAIEMAVPAIDGWSDRPPSERPETTLARSSAAYEASPSVGMSAAWRELAVAFPRPRLAHAASCRASKLLLQPLPLH